MEMSPEVDVVDANAVAVLANRRIVLQFLHLRLVVAAEPGIARVYLGMNRDRARGPVRTVISPERVSTSRSTAPLTWNERSKVPMTEAKPASELAKIKTSVRTARCRIGKELVMAV